MTGPGSPEPVGASAAARQDLDAPEPGRSSWWPDGGGQGPHDHAAERATLGAVLLSARQAGLLLPVLRPEQFHDPVNARILTAMQTLHSRSEPVDPLTVHAALRRDGLDRLAGSTAVVLHGLLRDTPAAESGRYYASIVTETAAARRVRAAGVRLAQLAETGQATPEELLTEAVRELACIRAVVERHQQLATVRGRSPDDAHSVVSPVHSVPDRAEPASISGPNGQQQQQRLGVTGAATDDPEGRPCRQQPGAGDPRPDAGRDGPVPFLPMRLRSVPGGGREVS